MWARASGGGAGPDGAASGQSAAAASTYFLKQLGAIPTDNGKELKLEDTVLTDRQTTRQPSGASGFGAHDDVAVAEPLLAGVRVLAPA